MRRLTPLILLLGLFLVSTASVNAFECRDRNSSQQSEINLATPDKPLYSGKGGQTFTGHLRVFVVEPTSRWRDQSNRTFNFAQLDLAVDQSISIPYQDSYTLNTSWDGSTVVYNDANDNFGDVTEDNIMVIAAVYDSIPQDAYSNPPSGDYFVAYYCVASAGATPGNPGSNQITGNFTHTVFVEEGATET